MGEPASQPACISQIFSSSAGLRKAFAYQCVYAPPAICAPSVYARKRTAAAPESHIVKLLIQKALTLVNKDAGSVYRQYPIWG